MLWHNSLILVHVGMSLLDGLNLESSADQSMAAIISENQERLDYASLHKVIQRLTHDLSRHRCHAKTRVATIDFNGTSNSVLMLAVINTSVCCPISPYLKDSEIVNQLVALSPDVVVFNSLLKDRLVPICNQLHLACFAFEAKNQVWDIEFTDIYTPISNSVSREESQKLKSKNDYSLILLTSGSTGFPKRVGLSLENLLSSASEVAQTLSLSPGDICLSMWEQYHIGGVVDLLLAPLIAGSTVEMTSGFSIENFSRSLDNSQFTWFQCVPTTLREILFTLKRDQKSLPNQCRFVRSVASGLPVDFHQEAELKLGVPILQTYGMTEASPLVTSNLLDPQLRRYGSVGKPLSTQIKININNQIDDNDHQVGEILIKGVNVITQYDDATGETLACFEDGWFRTGDLGYFDKDGFLFLYGREKQQINRGGEKISPKEVEACCLSHRSVQDALVVGVSHPTLGSVPAALITHDLKLDSSGVISSLREFLGSRLSTFKQPVYIWCVEKLPKTVTGKVLHGELEVLVSSLLNRKELISDQKHCDHEDDPLLTNIQFRLKGVWEDELGLNDIQLDDDFVALGGDSLSSLRLLFAAESCFGIKYPLEKLVDMTTISSMALLTRDLLADAKKKANCDPTTNARKGKKVKRKKVDKEFRNMSFEQKIDMLDDASLIDFVMNLKSAVKIKTAIEQRKNIWTPRELADFANVFSTRVKAKSMSDDCRRLHQSHHESLMNNRLNALALPYVNWKRIPLEQGACFYSSSYFDVGSTSPTKTNDKTLIIGFGGKFNRMMLPMYLWLGQLNHDQYDFLFVWDNTTNYYRSGAGEFAESPTALLARITGFIQSHGYSKSKVIGIGTSMGGHPCAAIIRQLGCQAGLLISPGKSKYYPEYVDLLETTSSDCMLHVICGADFSEDVVSAKRFSSKFRHCEIHLIDNCATHNPLWHLYQQGTYVRFLENMLERLVAD